MTDGGQTGHIGTRSILFTDLVGSTEQRVRLGEEGADTVRRQHEAVMTDAVTQCGGTVVKGLGDGLMVAFDSAVDAVAAAVAVQQAAEAHGRRKPAEAFTIRVGLSVGDVSAEDGDLFGVPVVEAARLCDTAIAGEILAADLVRALARGRGGAAFEPMGDIALKGLPDPVPTCRILWEPLADLSSADPDARVPIPPPLLGSVASYVGRESLREQLQGAWEHAQSGSARTVLLGGEPGVGKTRTSAEISRKAFGDGAVVLYGRCDEDLGVPYQPFVEALDHYVRHAPAPELGRLPGELQRLVPSLASHAGPLPAAVASDPASEEHRLFEATASWLSAAARAAGPGLVLVLDDIHWATKPTLQLLQYVARSVAPEGAPLLMVATYRDTDINRRHPLSAAMADLRRLPGVDRIAVENLTDAEVIAFITNVAGHELDADTLRLAEVVFAETEGNPFFVGEVLRHLIETGSVRRAGDRWVVFGDPEHIAVPEGVRDVVGRRLSRLSPEANDVLSVAAVFGRDFHVAPLMAVTRVGEDKALDALDDAVRARLVEETGVDCYRFAHALVRTTLYEELSATRRRRLHRSVAEALEKLEPGDINALAYHFTEAGPEDGDSSRAITYTLAAGEAYLAGRAFADAEVRFRSALELMPELGAEPSKDRVQALCGVGEAERDQGDPAFRGTLLDAARQAHALGDPALMARAVLANSRGFASNVGDVDVERVELIEAALELVPVAPTSDRARLLAQLAAEITFSGRHERRWSLAAEAEAMARGLEDDVLLGDVLVTTSFAAAAGDRWPQHVARCAEATRLADASADPTRRVIARIAQSSALIAIGDLEGERRLVTEAVEIAERDGTPTTRWMARCNALRHPIMEGRIAEAEALNDELLAISLELGQADGEQWWQALLLATTWLRGREADLVDVVGERADALPRSRNWRTGHVWLLAMAGRVDEARASIEHYDLDPQAMIDEPWAFLSSFHLGIAAWHLNDPVLARGVADSLEPHRDCWCHYNLVILGPVTWILGACKSVLGEHVAAVRDLEDACAALERNRMSAYLPHVRVFLAQAIRLRGAAGDAARSEELLGWCRNAAEELGATGLVERLDRVRDGWA